MALRILRIAFCAAGLVTVLLAAAALAFGCYGFYVLTSEDPSGMQPGTVRYETREFWLSLDDWNNGRGESWTAEWPDAVKVSR